MVKIKRARVCLRAAGVTVSDTTAGPEHRGGAGGLPTWRLHVFLDPRVGTDARRSFALQLTSVRTKTIRLCYV